MTVMHLRPFSGLPTALSWRGAVLLAATALLGAAGGSTPARRNAGAADTDVALAATDTLLAGIALMDSVSRTDMQAQTQSAYPEPDGNPYLREPEENSWFREFVVAPAKLSTQYELSYNVVSPSGLRNNRNSLRIEYAKFFLEHFYLGVDARLTAFWPDDHRTRSTTFWLNDEESREDVSFAALAREAYLQASLGTLSLKAGTQVPAWGEFEFVSITDELSPQDFREPLVVSLEELRLGQPMVILDQYSGLGNLSAFVVPYPLFNEHPREGTRYYFDPFAGNFQVSEWKRDPLEMEYGLRWKRNFDKTDIGLVAARLVANEPFLAMTEPGKIRKGAQEYALAGASLDHAFRNILLKAEFAAKLPRAFMDDKFAKAERNVLDAALGLTYTWNATTILTIESANSHILDWTSRLQGVPEDSYTLVGMLRKQFCNDDLSLTWISMYTGPYTSYFHTLSAAYLWSDWITLSGELLLPDPDDRRSFAWQLGEQKQIAFRIKHQF